MICLGGFAVVYRGRLDNDVVALKELIVLSDSSEQVKSKSFRELRREATTMSILKHPNIVQLKGTEIVCSHSCCDSFALL